jgi:flagellar assembly protein FliH
MKSSPDKIQFHAPLLEVRLAAPPHNEAQERRIRERERTSFELGRAEGEKALGVQLVQQRSDLLALQNGVLDALRQCIAHNAREQEGLLVELALEVAQKLVAGIAITPEMVESAVHEALSQMQESTDFTVVLHAEDLALLQRVNSPLTLNSAAGQQVRFETSNEIGRGGCVVHTRFGTVDARREIKFELLKKSLQG